MHHRLNFIYSQCLAAIALYKEEPFIRGGPQLEGELVLRSRLCGYGEALRRLSSLATLSWPFIKRLPKLFIPRKFLRALRWNPRKVLQAFGPATWAARNAAAHELALHLPDYGFDSTVCFLTRPSVPDRFSPRKESRLFARNAERSRCFRPAKLRTYLENESSTLSMSTAETNSPSMLTAAIRRRARPCSPFTTANPRIRTNGSVCARKFPRCALSTACSACNSGRAPRNGRRERAPGVLRTERNRYG